MKWTKCLIIISIISLCFAKSPNKIISGMRTNWPEYCYVVSVQFLNTHLCGASILNSNYVLTTASCVTFDRNVLAGNLKLKMGTNDLFDTSNSTLTDVSYTIYHEDYDPKKSWMNDIALLRLASPILFWRNLCKISLPTSYLVNRQKYGLAGWGETNTNNQQYTPSRYLHMILLLNKSLKECRTVHVDIAAMFYNFRSWRIGCAKPVSNYEAVSLGDGGSGLVSMLDRIVGIVSLYITGKNPIIYTNVFNHRHWIEHTMGKISPI